jgi:predicted nuclease with RNAse H fold
MGAEHLQLVTLEEVREPEPPIRLSAGFYEPGSPAGVAAAIRGFDEVVVAIGAPLGEPGHGRPQRVVDELLMRRGVRGLPPSEPASALRHGLAGLAAFDPDSDEVEGTVPEGAFSAAPLIETNADAVFCTLQGARLPAKRHPHGMRLRVRELLDDHVDDTGGGLWDRRMEEIDAAAAALCAHRYAVGHASWLGDSAEGVVVLPGTSIPERFETEGVLAPVERLRLPEP